MSEVEVQDQVTICPYCMEEKDEHDPYGCCGESNAHFVKVDRGAWERDELDKKEGE